MKVYLWNRHHHDLSIHDVNPHKDSVKGFLFLDDDFTLEDFNYLTTIAKLIDENASGWKVWELELDD